jgi:hypothetical protein
MRRTDLAVPAHLVAGLRIPSLSVTHGEADVEWVEVPTIGWRFRRRPVQRLPLDPRSARRARRYIRLAPWSLSVSVVAFLAVIGVLAGHLRGAVYETTTIAVVIFNFVWSLAGVGGELPAQTPRRDRHGNLRIRDVPLVVALQWQDLNSGVTTSDEPAPRPRSRRFYAAWSAGLLLAALALGVVLANDGRQDFILLWAAVPALFLAGCAAALKLSPPGYIRFDRSDR